MDKDGGAQPHGRRAARRARAPRAGRGANERAAWQMMMGSVIARKFLLDWTRADALYFNFF